MHGRRGSDSSGHSSPMAWDASVRAAAQAHFDAGIEMETSSQGSAGNSSSHSRVRPAAMSDVPAAPALDKPFLCVESILPGTLTQSAALTTVVALHIHLAGSLPLSSIKRILHSMRQPTQSAVILQPKAGSWTSQRALEAQVATLRQQLDIAAATQFELQKEIDVRCACFLPSLACASLDPRILTCVRNRSVGLPA